MRITIIYPLCIPYMINLEHFVNSTIVTAQEATGLQVMNLIKVVGLDSSQPCTNTLNLEQHNSDGTETTMQVCEVM